jgi:hypothetical protein
MKDRRHTRIKTLAINQQRFSHHSEVNNLPILGRSQKKFVQLIGFVVWHLSAPLSFFDCRSFQKKDHTARMCILPSPSHDVQ